MAEFWKKIESDSIEIPNFIKNGFELCGYANALIFKNITDEDINLVENFIKNDVLTYLSKSAANAINESDKSGFVEDDDVLLDEEQLLDHFGKLYASRPESFRFQPGDRILIKALVEQVKYIVDGKGINTGLNKFKTKQNIKTNHKSKKIQSKVTAQLTSSDVNIENLKSDLIERVKKSMHSHRAHIIYNINLEKDVHSDTVHVYIENGIIRGKVQCIICSTEKKRIKLPKVHYSSGSKWPCWVLSNFKTHLRRDGLTHENKQFQLQDNNDPPAVDSNNLIEMSDDCDELANASASQKIEVKNVHPKVDLDCSVVCLDTSERFKNTKNHIQDNTILYTQLSTQITLMMSVLMKNSEPQDKMYFQLNDQKQKTVTVAEIPGDGNCLFSTLTHQLEKRRINSKSHQAATTKLRNDVVKYILNEENFPKFSHQLRGRIYDLKNPVDIENIDTECKLFVKYVLSQNKCWGGAETISAVSEMKQVNIVLFCENGPCYMKPEFNELYSQTICIAHRLAQNGDEKSNETLRNHYDSVCDVKSDVLYEAAQIIVTKQK